jgi:hypothetical protein
VADEAPNINSPQITTSKTRPPAPYDQSILIAVKTSWLPNQSPILQLPLLYTTERLLQIAVQDVERNPDLQPEGREPHLQSLQE